ncbi:MAG: UDP-glucose 4-epimerase GalE [Candidatus Doudnabacteria bacterium CG10_big_fil_rev_8_21_14_0_10_41_10]|uniref:UDP-glucose 4-epimerase n=1 Tax=Candidatus Doudnabacteria bacterium CG10_big_fil_rev_8_21_14_0_10_41_10 TaxID=1974551 RepID=A0A2H0VFQ5_9BACT|nr:MAG: UDP-glucose 4-epimerase GalE [Candidatus Doudnabacteria bacterium CG10_big_fil_rev_8_21_14_0_10_41_10]
MGENFLGDKKLKKVLVTGGAGYIGSHAGRLLVERGYDVTTFDNLSTGHREFAQGEFIEGDLADREFLDKVFSQGQFDAVMHFAASIQVEESVKNPLKYFQNNVVNGLNLLETMVRHNVKNIVFSSTCVVCAEDSPMPVTEEAETKPTNPYGETKLAFENILKTFAVAYGIKSVVLRYFNVAGASLDQTLGLDVENPSHLIPSIFNVALGKKESLTVFGEDYNTHDGTAVRDFVHVLDLAQAHQLALEYLSRQDNSVSEVFNVGSGRGYSVMEVVNASCEITGRMVRMEVGPRRPGDREEIYADVKKIKQVLGFEPKYSNLKTILQTHWAFHKKRFGDSF